MALYLETDELLHATNLQLSKTSHFENINGRKSLANANSNCSLLDEKQTIQKGKALKVSIIELAAK